MKNTAILIPFLLFRALVFGQNAAVDIFEFKNGQIWDGAKFSPGDFYVSGKNISIKKPGEPTRTFDLTGQFVVPPVGDAGFSELRWRGKPRVRAEKLHVGGRFLYRADHQFAQRPRRAFGKIEPRQ